MQRDEHQPCAYGGDEDAAAGLGHHLCLHRHRDIFHEERICPFPGDGGRGDHVDAAHEAAGRKGDEQRDGPQVRDVAQRDGQGDLRA